MVDLAMLRLVHLQSILAKVRLTVESMEDPTVGEMTLEALEEMV